MAGFKRASCTRSISGVICRLTLSMALPNTIPVRVVTGSGFCCCMVRSAILPQGLGKARNLFACLKSYLVAASRPLWHLNSKSARPSASSAMSQRSCCVMACQSGPSTANEAMTHRACVQPLPLRSSRRLFRKDYSVPQSQKKKQPPLTHAVARQTGRWKDGTPRSQFNAFTGHGYTDDERKRANLTRTQVLNGHLPHANAGKTMPWDGPYTRREGGK